MPGLNMFLKCLKDQNMGIHHTYKSQRGERSLKKQKRQMEKQRRSKIRKISKHQEKTKDTYVVPQDEILTLDILTDPNKRK